MDKRLKEMEEKLFNYFNRSKRLHTLDKRLKLLKDQVFEIECKLKNVDYNLPEESMSIGYEERVQSSPTNNSHAERALDNITDKLKDQVKYRESQINDIEETIRQITDDNLIIEENIKDLGEWHINFLKLKYKYRRKDWQVAQKLNISQTTATRKKNELLANIYNWFMLMKSVH